MGLESGLGHVTMGEGGNIRKCLSAVLNCRVLVLETLFYVFLNVEDIMYRICVVRFFGKFSSFTNRSSVNFYYIFFLHK